MNDAGVPVGMAVAVVVGRDGRLPAGADETVAEACGRVVVVGSGIDGAVTALPSATYVWSAGAGPGLGTLAARLAAPLAGVPLILLPASPDGRDLAALLAATMGRPLLASAVRARVEPGSGSSTGATDGVRIHADLLRVDGRVTVPVELDGPAVVTLMPGVRNSAPSPTSPFLYSLELDTAIGADPDELDLIEPDPATMDLTDATRVLAAGAGLFPRGATDQEARAVVALLAEVAAALGASMGATRVVTDAGWADHQRQIGTTGVTIDPDLYVAFGVSGATQHTGGLGSPRHTVSINIDPSCPMTAMADLGLVTDATALLIELATRLGVEVTEEIHA